MTVKKRILRYKVGRPIVACELYKFPLPKGWKEYISGDEIGLAAEDFPAWMWIYPHRLRTIEEVESELKHGAKSADIELMTEGVPRKISRTAIAANFHGLLNSQETRVRLIGTLTLKLGGVFIFAATNSDEYFSKLSSTADDIALEIQYG
jgi:hypothetical protein